jgi:uncharacterized protein DUF6745
MARVEKLTLEEEALLPIIPINPHDEEWRLIRIVRDEWIRIGQATGAADREAAQAAISDAYRNTGLEPPRIWIWLGSPWAGCIGAWMISILSVTNHQGRGQATDQVRNEVVAQGDQIWEHQVWGEVRSQVTQRVWDWGQAEVWRQMLDQMDVQVVDQLRTQFWHRVGDQVWEQLADQAGGASYALPDVSWLAFYDSFRIKRGSGPERLRPHMELGVGVGGWWLFRGACIITERPTTLHRDGAGRLHCDIGPAIAYPDNWAIHAWHGTRIPSWFIEEKHRITPDAIEAEENAELRRVMLEIFGFDKYMEARGARLIAEDECLGLPRQPFEIDLRGERIRVLRVVNGTLEADGRRRQFHLGVPLECNTPHGAVAWSYGRPPTEYREALRT